MSYIADDGVKWFKIEYPTFYGRNTAPIKRRKKISRTDIDDRAYLT
jgi:hypothetical protein